MSCSQPYFVWRIFCIVEIFKNWKKLEIFPFLKKSKFEKKKFAKFFKEDRQSFETIKLCLEPDL